MAQFHGLCPFGLFRFTSAPTPAETAYRAYVAGLGTQAFKLAQDGANELEAKVYATAIQVGVARACGIEKAWNQQIPSYASDKLPSLEADWGVAVGPNDSLQTQQQKVAAQFLLQRGARQEAVESALAALLGADFYALRVTKPGEIVTVPSVPTTAGTWQAPRTTPKLVKFLTSVPALGSATVSYALVGTSLGPIVGDRITVDPGLGGARTEAVTVTALSAVGATTKTLTATFSQPHDAGTLAGTCMPWWLSNQRHVFVIVGQASARSAETRRKIGALMSKHMRSATDWDILEVATPTTVGPFIVGSSPVGVDVVGPASFTF